MNKLKIKHYKVEHIISALETKNNVYYHANGINNGTPAWNKRSKTFRHINPNMLAYYLYEIAECNRVLEL